MNVSIRTLASHLKIYLNETLDALEYGDGAEEEEDPEEDVEEEPPGR